MGAYRAVVAFLLVGWIGCKAPPPPLPPPEIDFRQELRPYGQWLVVAPFGRVWAPNPAIVGKDFTPYLTDGHWEYSPKGWSFASGFRFGDLVFHYGRWVRVQSLDWLWVEDKVWGPSWVDWKVGSEYVGWAPTLPVAAGGPPPAPPEFVFVKARNFARPEIEKFRVAGDDVGRAVDHTSPLGPSPGAPPGPPLSLILTERGLVKDDKGNLRVPDFPSDQPATEVVAPLPEPAPQLVSPPPPPPEKKKHKHKRRHR